MRKFQFKQAYEEIEIAGEVYRISLADKDRKVFNERLRKYSQLTNKAKSGALKEISVEETLQFEEDLRNLTLESLDAVFGEGTGKKLYELSGEQSEELMPILFEVANIINERRQEQLKKYSKKK